MLDERDREAMQEAIDMQRAVGPAEAEQIDAFLQERGFERTGAFAAYAQQYDHLRCKPWEATPSQIAPDQIDPIIAAGPNERRHAAAKLARRMLDSGVSLFAPDPERALREAARRPAA
jgi:hypothetical protein